MLFQPPGSLPLAVGASISWKGICGICLNRNVSIKHPWLLYWMLADESYGWSSCTLCTNFDPKCIWCPSVL